MEESMITIRVPKEMREKMRRAGINWSEELRHAIESKLDEGQRRKANEELELIMRNVKPGFDSTRAIREAREHG